MNKPAFHESRSARSWQWAPPRLTPIALSRTAAQDLAAAMNGILADIFALYLKTKSFHWNMSGPHLRQHHAMLDKQADELHAMTGPMAERIRELGGPTLRSIGHIARARRILDNDDEHVEPSDMLAELWDDNKAVATRLRQAHDMCDAQCDFATASDIDGWIDETMRRAWFLLEAGRLGDAAGH